MLFDNIQNINQLAINCNRSNLQVKVSESEINALVSKLNITNEDKFTLKKKYGDYIKDRKPFLEPKRK